MRGDFAHVGIAGGKSPGMLDLDVIAMAAMTTRIDDLATGRSEEHTSELQSLMCISYAVFCLKKKKIKYKHNTNNHTTYLRVHINTTTSPQHTQTSRTQY